MEADKAYIPHSLCGGSSANTPLSSLSEEESECLFFTVHPAFSEGCSWGGRVAPGAHSPHSVGRMEEGHQAASGS